MMPPVLVMAILVSYPRVEQQVACKHVRWVLFVSIERPSVQEFEHRFDRVLGDTSYFFLGVVRVQSPEELVAWHERLSMRPEVAADDPPLARSAGQFTRRVRKLDERGQLRSDLLRPVFARVVTRRLPQPELLGI